jgi:8-oxo-dGTP diphosphatase
MAQQPILAAGGIVVRAGRPPLIAVVQLRKRNEWVLPKGKLGARESALSAAKREVLEETGQDVVVHEFLGAMSYDVRGRPKVVQFWSMEATDATARELMHDVLEVRWLPLADAIETLTHVREQVFLANVGPVAVTTVTQHQRQAPQQEPAPSSLVGKVWTWLRHGRSKSPRGEAIGRQ